MIRALLCALLALVGCADKRKPIARGDGGPSVVVLEGRPPDLGALPSTPEVEPNDTFATAEALGTARIGATLSVGGAKPDVDVFRIVTQNDVATKDAVDGGESIEVATIIVRSGDGAIALDLLDGKGKPLLTRTANAHERAQMSNVRLDLGAVARVRRLLKKGEHATTPIDYTIEAASRATVADEELEPNDDVAHANLAGARATGVIDPGDRDVFALPRTDGTYRVELAAVTGVAPELRLRRGDETLVTAHTAKDGELRLRNLPGGEGLTLQLRAIDGNSDVPYLLQIATEPSLDATVVIEHEPNDDRAHANHVVPGDIVGYLWPGDWDWFCADGPIGARIDAMPDVDWKLELFDASGKSLAKADAGKRGSAESIEVLPEGRCVRVSAHGRDVAFDAPYRLTITPAK